MTKKADLNQYKRFEEFIGNLFAVPHSEIKAKLEAEKNAKKRKKSRISSASHEGV